VWLSGPHIQKQRSTIERQRRTIEEQARQIGKLEMQIARAAQEERKRLLAQFSEYLGSLEAQWSQALEEQCNFMGGNVGEVREGTKVRARVVEDCAVCSLHVAGAMRGGDASKHREPMLGRRPSPRESPP
jgi:hypothetical protein